MHQAKVQICSKTQNASFNVSILIQTRKNADCNKEVEMLIATKKISCADTSLFAFTSNKTRGKKTVFLRFSKKYSL